MTKRRRHRALGPGLGCSTAQGAGGTEPGGLSATGRSTSFGPGEEGSVAESGSPVGGSPLEEAPVPAGWQAESAAENRDRRRSCSWCENGSEEGAGRARACLSACLSIDSVNWFQGSWSRTCRVSRTTDVNIRLRLSRIHVTQLLTIDPRIDLSRINTCRSARARTHADLIPEHVNLYQTHLLRHFRVDSLKIKYTFK